MAARANRGRSVKILLVEDEDPSIASTRAMLDRADPACDLRIARSRETAITALDSEAFDLVLCDVRIPVTDGALGAEEEHGLAVHRHARSTCPGTPLVFLTGFATSRATRTELSAGPNAEMYGELELPLVQLADKDDPADSEAIVSRIVRGLEALEASCGVRMDGSGAGDEMLMRAIRTYARRIGAHAAEATLMGGLSGASVARVSFAISGGGRAASLVKVLDRAKAIEEMDRYERYVPNRLAPGAFAPAMQPITHGLRRMGALFFTLADPASRSLFRVLEADPSRGSRILDLLRANLRPWLGEGLVERLPLAELRRRVISDERLSERRLDPCRNEIEELVALEGIELSLPMALAHGDLHGENILVDSRGLPVLIDFGDAGWCAPGLDPITLEMSLLFHSEKPVRGLSQMTVEQAAKWGDVDYFAAVAGAPEFVRACRQWALEAGGEAAYGTAYAHAMRQLKYGDVSPRLALAVARSARSMLTG